MKKNTRQKLLSYIINNVLLVGLLGLAVAEVRKEFFTANASLATLVVIGIILIVGTNQLLKISNKIDDMTRPVKTTLLDAEGAYERGTELVLNAEDEVLAVHNWTLGYQRPRGGDDNRRKYFSTLLDIAIKKKNLKYRRIIQIPSSGCPERTRDLLSELRKCAEATKETNRIQVRASEPRYLINFLLIDRRAVLIQVDNRDEETGRYEFNKCIIIEDDTEEVTSVFRAMFDELDVHSKLMEPGDLDKFVEALPAGAP